MCVAVREEKDSRAGLEGRAFLKREVRGASARARTRDLRGAESVRSTETHLFDTILDHLRTRARARACALRPPFGCSLPDHGGGLCAFVCLSLVRVRNPDFGRGDWGVVQAGDIWETDVSLRGGCCSARERTSRQAGGARGAVPAAARDETRDEREGWFVLLQLGLFRRKTGVRRVAPPRASCHTQSPPPRCASESAKCRGAGWGGKGVRAAGPCPAKRKNKLKRAGPNKNERGCARADNRLFRSEAVGVL